MPLPQSQWLILGAGGHAGVVLRLLQTLQQPVSGYVSPESDSKRLALLSWQGDDPSLTTHDPLLTSLANGLGSAGPIVIRKQVYEHARSLGFRFPNLIHPQAFASAVVHSAKGLQVHAMAVINGDVEIGENVLINTAATVEHDCMIGNHSHVASGAVICGEVSIGQACHIGANATINQGLRIGDGAVIASGSVVIHDVPSHTLMAGVPATVKKQLAP